MDQVETAQHEFKLHNFGFQGISSVESALWRCSSYGELLGTENIMLNKLHDFQFRASRPWSRRPLAVQLIW